MAIVRAVKSGNWSDTTVWNTGELPTAADDVYSNTFTVTIDVSPNVLSLRASSGTGIVAGGTFIPLGGTTLTCTGAGIVAGGAVTNPVLSVSITAEQTFNLVSSLTQYGNSARHMNMTGAGIVYITGDILSPVNAPSIVNSSTGTINVTGNVTGTNNAGQAIQNTSAGTVIVTGSVRGALSDLTGYGINNSSIGTVQVTGSVIGQSSSPAVSNGSSGTMTIIGSAIGVLGAAIGPGSTSQNTFLTGPFIGSALGVAANTAIRWRWFASVGPSYMTAVNSTATGYKNLYTTDSVDGESGQPAITNVRSGTIYGPNSELTGTCAVPPAASVLNGVPVDNTTGTVTITAADIRSAVGLASANLDTQLDALPTAAEVAAAVWSAASRTLTTAIDNSSTIAAAVWAAASRTITGGTVDTLTNAPDVPTAEEIAAEVWSASTDDYTANGTFGASVLIGSSPQREVAVTGSHHVAADIHELQDAVISAGHFASGAFDGVRASIGLASANLDLQIDAIPTATENATAARSELNVELGRIDAAISSRLEPDGTLARVTLVDTTTSLTNIPDVPTPSEIAEQIRTELTPELQKIDVEVSSRLSPSETLARVTLVDTTTQLTESPGVPTAEQIATAVREELEPELERVANCATVETTGAQVAAVQ